MEVIVIAILAPSSKSLNIIIRPIDAQLKLKLLQTRKRRRAEKLKRKKSMLSEEMRWSEKTRLEWIFMCLLHDYMTKPIQSKQMGQSA